MLFTSMNAMVCDSVLSTRATKACTSAGIAGTHLQYLESNTVYSKIDNLPCSEQNLGPRAPDQTSFVAHGLPAQYACQKQGDDSHMLPRMLSVGQVLDTNSQARVLHLWGCTQHPGQMVSIIHLGKKQPWTNSKGMTTMISSFQSVLQSQNIPAVSVVHPAEHEEDMHLRDTRTLFHSTLNTVIYLCSDK